MYCVLFLRSYAPSTAFTINNTNIVFSDSDATDTVDFVLVLGETVSIGTPSDGTAAAAQLHSTLDLSSKTVTLPNTSVTNAQLQNSSITINGSSVALGGSTTISTIARPTITTSSAVIAPEYKHNIYFSRYKFSICANCRIN